MMFGHFLVIPFVNPYMTNNVGYDKEFTPLTYLVGGVTSFISTNLLGRWADKYGKLTIYSVCILLALPIIFLLTNLPFHVNRVLALTLFGV